VPGRGSIRMICFGSIPVTAPGPSKRIGIVISGGIGYILVCVRVLFLSVRARIGHVPLSFRLGFRHIMLDFGLSLRLVASGQRGCCGDERAECFEMHR